MKSRSALLLCLLLPAVVGASAQIFRTNQVGRVQAIKVASRLAVGMKEADAYTYVETNGFTAGYTIGGRFGGTRFYRLSDGWELDLEINVKPGTWTNRVLTGASVRDLTAALTRSNDVKAVSIKLANSP
jgi:hypothetical protein